jgi:adenylyltransferase/sulfurtransferase
MFNLFGRSSELDLPAPEVKAKKDRGEDFVLVDVRDPWEWNFNRIDGAVHIPLSEIPNRYKELDPNTEIVAYCHMGVRSLKAAQFLKSVGFEKVWNLSGGIEAWSVQVDPEVPRYR